MDIVFIDTSVFVSENFLEGKRIRQVFKLAAEEHIQLVLPEISYNEILSRISKSVAEAMTGYKALREKTRVIRNIPGMEKRFDKIEKDAITKEVQDLFRTKLGELGTVIIPYPTIDIGQVFTKYFADDFPFNSTEKKNEFPDAFTLATLEQWAIANGKRCIVIAGDKDLINYQNQHLRVYPSLADYLDVKLRRVAARTRVERRIEIAQKLFSENKLRLSKEIERWLQEELDDERTYFRHTQANILGISVNAIDVELGEPQVSSISDELILSVEAEVSYEVEVEVEDTTSGYYDEDSRDWVYTDTETERIARQKFIPITLKVDFPLAGDAYASISIEEINNGKDFNV